MFFNNVAKFPFKESINFPDKIYAHTKEGANPELLEEHIDLCVKYLEGIFRDKNLDKSFIKIFNVIMPDYCEYSLSIFKELILNTVYMHDIGKINRDFQRVKMKNPNFKKAFNIETNHSLSSAIVYINYFIERIIGSQKKLGESIPKLVYIMFLNAYIISKHHGNLGNFEDFLDEIKNDIENFKDKKELYDLYNKDIVEVLDEKNIKSIIHHVKMAYSEDKNMRIELYIYGRMLFSILTTCDFYATYEYNEGRLVEYNKKINNVDKYYDVYKSKDFYKNMKMHEYFLETGKNPVYKEDDINMLRAEMNQESEKTLVENISENIFYLEAPTGSGKTVTSINLALKTLELDRSINRIFYIFPFNTLIEQTNKVFSEQIFGDVEDVKDDVAIVNSITPIKTSNEGEESSVDKINYEKALLDRQFLHYPIVMTTNISFFNYLFGTGRDESFPLIQLANSVIILDEIQSYKNEIWKEMIIFFEKYAKILNIKIIIMSATLPRLGELIDEDTSFTYLIKDRRKYYLHKLFKDRVSIDYSLLEKGVIDEDYLTDFIVNEFCKNRLIEGNTNKILIECMKKKTAHNIYKKLKIVFDDTFLITGDDNKIERQRVISKTKELNECILVSTQVVEAGVDIDMDIGFKDISILDSEEQFLGRINRSCKKMNCRAFFFNLDDISKLYKNDYRKIDKRTLNSDYGKEILKLKEFDKYYADIIKDMNEIKKDSTRYSMKKLDQDLKKLDFVEIEKRMTLIDKASLYTIFLNTVIDKDGEQIIGSNVWEEYVKILENKDSSYAERVVLLSKINELLSMFTYQVYKFSDRYDEEAGYIKYIENGEKYIEDGKFNREKYSQDSEIGYCLY